MLMLWVTVNLWAFEGVMLDRDGWVVGRQVGEINNAPSTCCCQVASVPCEWRGRPVDPTRPRPAQQRAHGWGRESRRWRR